MNPSRIRQTIMHSSKNISPVKVIGFLLILIALAIGTIGYFNKYKSLSLNPIASDLLNDFYANLSTELGSLAIVILIIDSLYDRMDVEKEKATLIFDMGSQDNKRALEALRKVISHRWLSDGSLRGKVFGNLAGAWLQGADLSNSAFGLSASLENANLENAILQRTLLSGANLKGANLRNAKLKGAYVDIDQLSGLHSLAGAEMPDGKRYNGCFNLPGDFKDSGPFGIFATDKNGVINREDVVVLELESLKKYELLQLKANWYGVSKEEYIKGQEWAKTQLRQNKYIRYGLNPTDFAG